MEENNGKRTSDAVKTYTKEEVIEIVNRAISEQQNHYSWAVSKVNWMLDIIKNRNLFNDRIVELSEMELEHFLFPEPNSEDTAETSTKE